MENSLYGGEWRRPPKRTHSQMSSTDLDSIPSHPTATSGRGEPQEQSRAPPPLRTSRYSGDGFDFRRPATPSRAPSGTSNPHNVSGHIQPPEIIDLTNTDDVEMPPSPRSLFGQASRGPRFARDIIDLSGEMPNSRLSHLDDEAFLDALEVQFVSEQQLPPPAPANSRRVEIPLNNVYDLTEEDLLEDDDDEVQFIMETRRPNPAPQRLNNPTHGVLPQQNTPLLRATSSIANGLRQLAGYRTDQLNPNSSRSSYPHPPEGPPAPVPMHNWPADFASPQSQAMAINMGLAAYINPNLDFTSVGFDMGLDEPSHNNAAVRAPPAPPSPPPGFTRTPKPDEVYVCPNCDRELCSGETDIQKQVWIIRACGHTYCGECATQRHVSKRKKTMQPLNTKPFAACVEESCRKRIAGARGMIQVFL